MHGITNLEILSNDAGRWGNQLFRIATMIGYAKQYNLKYYISNTWQYKDYFNFGDNLYDINDILLNIKYKHSQNGFHYEDIPYIESGIIDIHGFYQSYKFFDHAKDDIIELFWSNKNLIEDIKSKYNIGSNTLSIHIRGGDIFDRMRGGGYYRNEHHHPVMTIKYYNDALIEILKNVNINKILIFTDHEQTKNSIKGHINTHGIFTEYVDYKNEFIYDFFAQALCDHFIIANSSFSWWAAYIGRNKNKMVCSPYKNNWFGPGYGYYIMDDLIPPNWINISQ